MICAVLMCVAGSAAAPDARCRNCRRESFIMYVQSASACCRASSAAACGCQLRDDLSYLRTSPRTHHAVAVNLN
jgi:hypothetical protein